MLTIPKNAHNLLNSKKHLLLADLVKKRHLLEVDIHFSVANEYDLHKECRLFINIAQISALFMVVLLQ